MTQAFNLAQLANNLNTSGQLDASDGLFGTLPSTLFPNSGATAGSYNNANVTVNNKGIITAISSGIVGLAQIVSVSKPDSFTSTSGSYTDILGLSATITPTKTTSKILVLISVNVSAQDNCASSLRLLRGATEIGGTSGTNGGFATFGAPSFFRGSMQNISFTYLDSPSTTSPTLYNVQGITNNEFAINRSMTNETIAGRLANSTITLVEISL